MENRKLFSLFEEKARELAFSNFSKTMTNSGLKIRWERGKGFSNERTGPDYESIKNFVITFRNFILDSDHISIRNLAKVYDQLPEKDALKMKFDDARKKFNEFLDSKTTISFNGKNITNRELVETYIYGDVIHLEKHEEFKQWISMEPMKDMVFNEIVYVLGNCGNFIYFFDALNREYISDK